MKIVSFIILILAVILLVWGIFSIDKNNNKEQLSINKNIEVGNNIKASILVGDTNSSVSNIGDKNGNINNDAMKRFYPNVSQIEKQGREFDPERDFIITPEMKIKFYLVDKYNPGICYGMPTVVPDSAVSGMIARNPGLAGVVRQKYKLDTDLEVYEKIKQLNGIQLEKLAGGKYKFNFTDGQCCILTAYEGEVSIIANQISDKIIRQESKQNPC